MEFKDKFRKYDGNYINDIIDYIKDYIVKKPTVTITVGCDSIQERRKTTYAITIMLYETEIKKGAHVVYYKVSHKKIRNTQQRLYKEAEYAYNLAMYLDKELSNFYQRKDLNELNKKQYKYHLLKCDGQYSNVERHRENDVIMSLGLNESDNNFRLVDIHVDFNPKKGSLNENGVSKNKSYNAYKSYVPWLRGSGFRTWSKPMSAASTTAADFLLK